MLQKLLYCNRPSKFPTLNENFMFLRFLLIFEIQLFVGEDLKLHILYFLKPHIFILWVIKVRNVLFISIKKYIYQMNNYLLSTHSTHFTQYRNFITNADFSHKHEKNEIFFDAIIYFRDICFNNKFLIFILFLLKPVLWL